MPREALTLRLIKVVVIYEVMFMSKNRKEKDLKGQILEGKGH